MREENCQNSKDHMLDHLMALQDNDSNQFCWHAQSPPFSWQNSKMFNTQEVVVAVRKMIKRGGDNGR